MASAQRDDAEYLDPRISGVLRGEATAAELATPNFFRFLRPGSASRLSPRQSRGSGASEPPCEGGPACARPWSRMATRFSVDLEVRTLESQRRSLASLFLSTGRTSTMDMEERVARPCLARLRTASGLLQEGAQMDYFPDPPCILPCLPRPDCDDEEDAAAGMGESAPHSYWKRHATWLENWPSLDRSRTATREFVAGWGDDSGASDPQAFVNVCEQPVAVRSQPVDSSDAKTEVRVQPGEMVVVAEVVERQGTRYLRLASGDGWLFETQGRAPVMARMACVAVGSWWFRVACGEALEVHTAPTFAASPSGWVMSPTEIFLVDVKTRVRGCKFFHLADGRGWIPELRQPAHPRGSACSLVWPHADAPTLLVKEAEADLEGRSVNWLNYSSIVPSTSDVVEVGEWRYMVGELPVLAIGARQFGELLEPGESVKVDKRAFAGGDAPRGGGEWTAASRLWLRLRDGRGWVPETAPGGRPLLRLRGAPSYPGFCAGGRGSARRADPDDGWTAGLV